MKHLADYIQESISQGIDESIFSQTGIGDDEIIHRRLPLLVLETIAEYLKQNISKVEGISIGDGRYGKCRIEMSIRVGGGGTRTQASRKVFEELCKLLKEGNPDVYKHLDIDKGSFIISVADVDRIEPASVQVYNINAARKSDKFIKILLMVSSDFADTHENEIIAIFSKLKPYWHYKNIMVGGEIRDL